jgi:MFS family permease
MPGWLRESPPRFDYVFGFSGLLFALAALTLVGIVESADHFRPPAERIWGHFGRAFEIFRGDATFRTLAICGALFSTSIMLFPHYQNLGLSEMNLGVGNLMWWVVVQNLGTGLFSIPAGIIADRWGNRLVLQFALLGIAAAPTVAIGLMYLGPVARGAFPLVFVLIGLTPVVFRTFQNFALEICSAENHPRYLSALGLCIAMPMVLSPLVGLCVDQLGFEAVFLGIASIVLAGWVLTFRLTEPRQHVSNGLYPTDD